MSAVSVGAKIGSESGVEVIVVKASSQTDITFATGEPVLLGKRYQCPTCQAEVLVTKVGPESPICHGAPMTMAESKQLPSSD